jgi:hypothetical protein
MKKNHDLVTIILKIGIPCLDLVKSTILNILRKMEENDQPDRKGVKLLEKHQVQQGVVKLTVHEHTIG